MSGAAEHEPLLPARLLRVGAGLLTVISAAAGASLLFGWTGGALATDDLWWHLSLGDLYSQVGPRLEGDPRLHTARSAPHPNAWLFDRALFGVAASHGLGALRVLHVLLAFGILAVLSQTLRRTSRSTTWAVTGSLLFLALAHHRLEQLRPELATIVLCISLTALALWSRWPPSRLSGLAILAGVGLWPHLHPGFPLGVALLGGGAAAAGITALETERRGRETVEVDANKVPSRAWGLALFTVAAIGLTGLHPSGLEAWEVYVAAGREASHEAIIVDEWRAFVPFALPENDLPPSVAAWGAWWLTTLATLALGVPLLLKRRVTSASGGWVGFGLALGGLIAPLVAVRFLWLGFLPLLWVGAQLGPSLLERAGRRAAVALLGLSVVVVLAFETPGGSGAALAAPTHTLDMPTYDADRYYAHALWFLSDTHVEGRLFHPYFTGGFAGFWLGSRIATFVDGSLNVPEGVLEDHAAILQDLPKQAAAADATEILDRQGVDVFLGVGLPVAPRPGRPWRYSTTLLEDDPRWILVYRGLRSAVYLRRGPGNEENLDRLGSYFARHDVPFDPQSGFLVAEVLEQASQWAIQHGVAPTDFLELQRDLEIGRPARRRRARERLAWVYAVLGEYETAWALGTPTGPPASKASRGEPLRNLWLALKLDLREEALRATEILAEANPASGTSLERAIRIWAEEPDPSARARHARRFVPLDRSAASRIAASARSADVRGIQDREPIPATRYSGSQSILNPKPNR